MTGSRGRAILDRRLVATIESSGRDGGLLSAPSDPIDFLCEQLARRTGVPRDRVTPTSRFIDFGLDSVKALDLVVELEQAYGIEVPDDDLPDLHTLADLAAYVRARLERGA